MNFHILPMFTDDSNDIWSLCFGFKVTDSDLGDVIFWTGYLESLPHSWYLCMSHTSLSTIQNLCPWTHFHPASSFFVILYLISSTHCPCTFNVPVTVFENIYLLHVRLEWEIDSHKRGWMCWQSEMRQCKLIRKHLWGRGWNMSLTFWYN